MKRPRAAAIAVAWGLFSIGVIAIPGPGRTQISPGPLSQRHARLEGAGSCARCHAPGRGVEASLCLDCHGLLRERIDASAGLHARPEYRACERCHVEHQGREFDLVWWGDAGLAAFDHALTGHALEGAHAGLDCRECHRAEQIADTRRLSAAFVEVDRTFLGLRTECSACHRDPHAGQFAEVACDTCHSQSAFAPASGFDHDRARFRLTGKHRAVACEGCHRSQAAAGAGAAADPAPAVRYRPVSHSTCASCHQDPHGGSLGAQCASCHSTVGWDSKDRSSFDHERTAYPLRGAHAEVPCSGCHGEGLVVARPASATCAACHRDPHLGQFGEREGGGACESCHEVTAFSPSTFTVDDHGSTSYPLEGSHRRVDCRDCHAPVEAELAATADAAPVELAERAVQAHGAFRFRFDDTACASCHVDPHRGDTDAVAGNAGCVRCHDLSGWASVAFDHGGTDFELARGHWGVECTSCHRYQTGGEEIRFALEDPSCAGCHADEHRSQFADAAGKVDCARCHADVAWADYRFDHAQSRFPLDGAHQSAFCEDCHPTELYDGKPMVRFRPLRVDCVACHGEPLAPPGP